MFKIYERPLVIAYPILLLLARYCGISGTKCNAARSVVFDMPPRRTPIADPAILACWFPQQPVMHSGFLTSGLGSPTNMLRFGILIAASVLASSVASAGSRPLRLRM